MLNVTKYFGLGNFWDWTFPYFSEHLANLFFNGAFSWTTVGLGKPLGYNSHLFADFVIFLSSLTKTNPEIVQIVIILLSFGLAGYFSFRTIMKKEGPDKFLTCFLALAIVINPAMNYKLLSGHLYYWLSFPIFVYIIFFLLYKFKNNLSSWLFLTFLISIVGTQIQFFLISLLSVTIYFLYNKKKFSIKYSIIGIVFIGLINSFWLSNFILGVNNVSNTSNLAAQGYFNDLTFANPVWIGLMIFSKATLITFMYSKPEFLFFGIFTLIIFSEIIYYLFIEKKRGAVELFFITNYLIFFFLGTGFYQHIPIPIIKVFYPMFREAGHFAPINLLFGIYILAFLTPLRKWTNIATFTILSIFLLINIHSIIVNVPKIDFFKAREKFINFEKFELNNNFSHRVLTYPFWNQYSFKDQRSREVRGQLMSNSSWDNYIHYSGRDFLPSPLYTINFTNSEQYRLLKSLDLSELENKNVKYLFDFSKFYESQWNRYISSTTYDNDLSIIKNDYSLFNKLLESNPGRIRKVSENIYELTQTKPRIYVSNTSSLKENVYIQRVNPALYKVNIKNFTDKSQLNFLENYHKDWKLYITNVSNNVPNKPKWCIEQQEQNNGVLECSGKKKILDGNEFKYLLSKPIADNSHFKYKDYGNSWILSKESIINSSKNNQLNLDEAVDVEMVIYFRPQSFFSIGLALSMFTIFGIFCYLLYNKQHRMK